MSVYLEASPANLDFSSRIQAAQRTRRSREARAGALLEMVRMAASRIAPGEIAQLILERAATCVPALCWGLVSADLSGRFEVLAVRGALPGLEIVVAAIAKWVCEHDGEFGSADLRRDPRVTHPLVGTVLAVPLPARGRCVGALVALDSEPSARVPRLVAAVRRDIRILLEPAAAALDMAVRLKHAEALSVTDDLTHLFNSRYLNLALRLETMRVRRTGGPLSLLFLDLDGFKSINDSYGHGLGSRALVEAAQLLRQCARETDIVARFGGDEFALVLTDTGSEGAMTLGHRIRERIAAHSFLASEGLDIHLTASVGVATLAVGATSPDELVHAADMAMYVVKRRGKNSIQAAPGPADT